MPQDCRKDAIVVTHYPEPLPKRCCMISCRNPLGKIVDEDFVYIKISMGAL